MAVNELCDSAIWPLCRYYETHRTVKIKSETQCYVQPSPTDCCQALGKHINEDTGIKTKKLKYLGENINLSKYFYKKLPSSLIESKLKFYTFNMQRFEQCL